MLNHNACPNSSAAFTKDPKQAAQLSIRLPVPPKHGLRDQYFCSYEPALGLEVRDRERQIHFANPCLPLNLDGVRIENLRLGDVSADFLIRRDGSSVAVEVLRKRGDIEILKSA